MYCHVKPYIAMYSHVLPIIAMYYHVLLRITMYYYLWISYKVPVLSLQTVNSKEPLLTLPTHEAYD